ncbi:hypothetical protein Bca4012_018365 [Brassica carinata]
MSVGESSSSSTDHCIKVVPTTHGDTEAVILSTTSMDSSLKFQESMSLLSVHIGRGACGIVCAAVNSLNGEKVATKKIGNPFDNIIDAKRSLREIKLLRHMDHENVIAIKDIVRPPQRDIFNDLIVYQLLRGLNYVHSANILPRDLRPSNVLLNSKHELKIGDFGLARTTSNTDLMTEDVVTRWYRASELLLDCSEYTAAIDIWSVVAARFSRMPSSAIDLLERMLIFDPNRRISVNEALGHAYLSPHHNVWTKNRCVQRLSALTLSILHARKNT